jgi:hypothetical protein
MNERLAQLKTAAEKVTVRSPEQFAEVFGRLMLNDLVKTLEDIENNEFGEVKNNMDTHLGWQIALTEVRVRMDRYFR